MSDLINKILMEKKATAEEALEAFDALEPIPVEFMHGRWKGFEIETGHPLGGLLVPAGWYGKVFLDNEEVHPIVFFGKDKTELYSVNPKLVPFEMKVPKDERLKKMISMVRVVLETTESKARLRPLGYRGKVSATMIYDEIPLIDIFVKIDERRVFGVADMKGQPPLFLVMERDDETKLALAALTAAEEKLKSLFDMEVQNRAFALKSATKMAEKSRDEADEQFWGSWVAFEQFLQLAYAPYARKFGLSQEPRGMASLQAGLGSLAADLLPDAMMFGELLSQTVNYLEKLKELDRLAPKEHAAFFSFVVQQEEAQIKALELRVKGKFNEAADLLNAFVKDHQHWLADPTPA